MNKQNLNTDNRNVKALDWSGHATKRMQQRGLRNQDVELVIRCGTPVNRDGILLRNRDIQREIAARKAEIQALERLKGVKVVVSEEGKIITVLHASSKHQKWITRH